MLHLLQMYGQVELRKVTLGSNSLYRQWLDLHKRIIGFRLLDIRDTSVNIAQRLVNVLEDFTLQNRVIAFTMDNASPNDKAIEILRPLVSGYNDSLLHQRCTCHVINLIVKAGLKGIEQYIHRLRFAVSYLKPSNQHIASFRWYYRHKCPPQQTFSIDVPSR